VDALLTTFIAALLAELGDKTQLLAIALAARFRKPGAVLAGIAVAALANNLIAAAGGVLIHGMITLRAISLLVAIALLCAGVSGLLRQKEPREMGSTWKTSAFATTAACFFLLEFGDKTQFLTAALAARYDSLGWAAAGATAGVILANAPVVVMLGERAEKTLRLKPIRLVISLLFLLTGLAVALNALRLV
jgi:putative Ca2+/H+ antiporter (TMEM165/GDT1 family)